jgi:hypothetical protein
MFFAPPPSSSLAASFALQAASFITAPFLAFPAHTHVPFTGDSQYYRRSASNHFVHYNLTQRWLKAVSL